MAVKMDTHIHTSFSTDSETDMQEQILTSYKKGLEGSVFIHCKRLHHSLSIPVWSVVCSLLLM